MTGYEATKRTIEFGSPDHLPVCLNAYEPDFTGDAVFVFLESPYKRKPGDCGSDEWGCIWQKTEVENIGQVTGHPIKDWDDLAKLSFPDPDDPFRYKGLNSVLDRGVDKYIVLCNGSAVFERITYLRGFAEILEDLHLNLSCVERLADRVLEFQFSVIKNISKKFPGRVHGFRITDDWGTQDTSMISPSLWDKVFKPRYKRLFEAVHNNGMHTWLHSCGKVNGLIDRFIEIGLDVINLEQPNLLGIEEVGKKFAGRICFESHCDLQTTLPKGDIEKIKEEAGRLLKYWARPEGGFILGDCGAVYNGISPAAKDAMMKSFKKHDPWRKRGLDIS